jgi:hypothetical protein
LHAGQGAAAGFGYRLAAFDAFSRASALRQSGAGILQRIV